MNLNYFIRLGCWGVLGAGYFMLTTAVQAQGLEPGRTRDGEIQRQETYLNHKNTTTDLLAQSNPITRVTGVEVKQTKKGLEVILKTAAGGQRLVPLILPEEKKF
jgi:hypothetical protein